jgi:hypothetical protein
MTVLRPVLIEDATQSTGHSMRSSIAATIKLILVGKAWEPTELWLEARAIWQWIRGRIDDARVLETIGVKEEFEEAQTRHS